MPKVLIGAVFFCAYSSAFVWAGDERLATVNTLVVFGTPIVMTAIVGNKNFWAFFQVAAIFFGYLWINFLAWAGASATDTFIRQPAVNYGMLLLAPN